MVSTLVTWSQLTISAGCLLWDYSQVSWDLCLLWMPQWVLPLSQRRKGTIWGTQVVHLNLDCLCIPKSSSQFCMRMGELDSETSKHKCLKTFIVEPVGEPDAKVKPSTGFVPQTSPQGDTWQLLCWDTVPLQLRQGGGMTLLPAPFTLTDHPTLLLSVAMDSPHNILVRSNGNPHRGNICPSHSHQGSSPDYFFRMKRNCKLSNKVSLEELAKLSCYRAV